MKALLLACSIICLSLGCASTSKLWIDEDLYSSYDCSDHPDDCLDYPYPWYGLYPDDLWYYDSFNYYYPYYPYYSYYPYYCWKDHPKDDKGRYLKEKRKQIREKIKDKRKARRKARQQRIERIKQVRQKRIELRSKRIARIRSALRRSRPRNIFKARPNVFMRR